MKITPDMLSPELGFVEDAVIQGYAYGNIYIEVVMTDDNDEIDLNLLAFELRAYDSIYGWRF